MTNGGMAGDLDTAMRWRELNVGVSAWLMSGVSREYGLEPPEPERGLPLIRG